MYFSKKLVGVLFLILTTILWGSSFVFIKLSVEQLSGASYTGLRSLFSVAALTPFLLNRVRKGELDRGSLKWGMATGVFYALGLLLQGEGTKYTTPSISAFVTGLNTLHVHVFYAFYKGGYGWLDALSLLLAISGLYILTSPAGEASLGIVLVFIGSIMWALQIIMVSKYSGGSSALEFLYGMMLPGALLSPYALIAEAYMINPEVALYLAYLSITCSLLASLFQIKGQARISAVTAAIIFLLEPAFALVFSVLLRMEGLEMFKVVGGSLIVLSTYLSLASEIRGRAEKDKYR